MISRKLLDELADVLARPKLQRWISQATASEYLDALESAITIDDPSDPPKLSRPRRWRSRIWRGEERPANRRNHPAYPGVAPAGTRPRDLRSSFITLQVYAGVPLTTIAKQCGTSVTMIEKHYAGVIENWDGVQQPAVDQIRAARQARGRSVDVSADSHDS